MEQAVKIGITSYANIKGRTIAIAKGEYKPRPDEPKVWITSFKSLASALEENQALSHSGWLREKLAKSAADIRPRVPHEQVMSEAQAIIDRKRKGP
jgi:predicted transcriptional regulator